MGETSKQMGGAAASERSNASPVVADEPVVTTIQDHVVVESTLQHGRELAASELGNVRPGVVEVPVAEIIQSEPGGVKSTDSECMDILVDTVIPEKRIEVVKRKMQATADDQGRITRMKMKLDHEKLADEVMRAVFDRFEVRESPDGHGNFTQQAGDTGGLPAARRKRTRDMIISMCDKHQTNLERSLSSCRDNVAKFWSMLVEIKTAASVGKDAAAEEEDAMRKEKDAAAEEEDAMRKEKDAVAAAEDNDPAAEENDTPAEEEDAAADEKDAATKEKDVTSAAAAAMAAAKQEADNMAA